MDLKYGGDFTWIPVLIIWLANGMDLKYGGDFTGEDRDQETKCT